jgi:hypothetical protein
MRDQVSGPFSTQVQEENEDLASRKRKALLLDAAGLNGIEMAICKAFHILAQHFGKRKIQVDVDLRRQVFAIVVKNGGLDEVDTLFFIILGHYDNSRCITRSLPSIRI